jgi:hypothetical protein
MVEMEEIATNDIIPSLPPLPGVAPLVHAPHAGDGQIWLLGSTGTAVAHALTPQPPQRILLPGGSTVSSLTNPTTATTSTSGTDNKADDTPKKRNVPKRKFPDFSCAFSQDNPLLLGNESDRWDNELDNIQERIAAANNLEHNDASILEDPVKEVQEFEYICENIAVEEEGKNTDNKDVYDSVMVTKKTHTVSDLKDLCKLLNLAVGGNKVMLFAWIWDCGNPLIKQIDDESFVFKKIRGEEADLSLPRWVILNPEPAPDIPGIDMLRGAEMGFFGPTNIENAVGAPKHQYCCSEEEKVRQPKFASKDPGRPMQEKAIYQRLHVTSCRMTSATAVQKTSLTPRSCQSLSRGASLTQPTRELRQRVPVLEGASIPTTSHLIWKRLTR